MFQFQKLSVYQKSKLYCRDVLKYVQENKLDRTVSDQLKRASLSIMLNIAEGSSRFTTKDTRRFMVISRGSAFECVAVFEYLHDNHIIEQHEFEAFLSHLTEISKMLFGMIRKLEASA